MKCLAKNVRVLLVCRYSTSQGAVVADSINAFHRFSKFDVTIYSSFYGFDEKYPFDEFDVIVVHYSVIPTLRGFIDERVVERLRNVKAVKVMMAQDEYRSTSKLISFANSIGTNVFFTVVPEHSSKALYSELNKNCRLITYLTGYISEELCVEPIIEIRNRRFDISYRGREYPAWFGQIMKKKIDLAMALKKYPAFSKLKLNVSIKEKDRLYGKDWVGLLKESRATFATESDVEIVDEHGRMMYWDMAFRSLLGDRKAKANFEKAQEKSNVYTRPFPGSLAVISPRILEAIALRTALIMPNGSYSGVLVPWRHYIPIEDDLSNAAEVASALRDEVKLAEIISNAFSDVAMNDDYSYRGFISLFDSTLKEFIDSEVSLNKDSRMSDESWLDFRKEVDSRYPFFFISNPHALNVISDSLISKLRRWLPSRYFVKLKSLFGR